MADDTYVFETYQSLGITQVTDDGTGSDWIVITGSYVDTAGSPGVRVDLDYGSVWDNPVLPTNALIVTQSWNDSATAIIYHTLQIFGTIENVLGSALSDRLDGSNGANVLQGDPMDASGGADSLYGWGGADTILGAGGSDYIQAGNDNDLMFGDGDPNAQDQGNYAAGDDVLYGGDSNDTIYGGYGSNFISGDAGYDTADYSGFFDDFGGYSYAITCDLETNTITVTERDLRDGTEIVVARDTVTGIEVVIGTDMNDTIYGRVNFGTGEFTNNTLHGRGGNDTLRGGPGADALFGGDGDDTMSDNGNTLPSPGSVDLLNGGLGNDDYDLGASTSRIIEQAGGGHDRVTVMYSYVLPAEVEDLSLSPLSPWAVNGTGNASDNRLEGNTYANALNGLGGNDVTIGLGANDTLRGGNGADSLYGGTENDLLLGGAQADALYGDMGSDALYGGFGNDRFYGGAQADFLQGGLGRDVLRGGAAGDTFYFASAAEASANGQRDLIADFTAGLDQIDLHRIALNQTFIGAATFNAIGSAEVRYDQLTGTLSGDTDGNGSADYQINLGAGTALATGDLIL